MKNLLCLLLVFVLWSCNDDDIQYETVNVAIPQVMSKAEFRNSVEILPSQTIDEAGKIYVYQDYIFVNDEFKGVHIIDNSNPASPQQISSIKIPGNVDISIKDNYLFADSSIDLLVFDISNINNIQMVERLEDVFSYYNYQIPVGTDVAEFGDYNPENDVIVGWELVQQQREVINDDAVLETFNGGASGDVGTGGSLARFQIVDNYLYTVGVSEMSIFNIENLAQPNLVTTQYSGWNIETMFHADGYLYLGGSNGMYIYSLENAANPSYVSEFIHWEGCDPVVVDGDYAYLTLRGGNECGQQESVLEVIDISDKAYPTLVAAYFLDNPYGLGFKGNSLYVCDGTSGLKVYDKTDPIQLQLSQTFIDLQAKDVVPMDDVLIMIGDNIVYQYEYGEGTLQQISVLDLN
ncbi:LVIVD repeat-containing protein [Gaetbulibacter sp. PBL-D1]|uniref:LVIVD repeat-containing protein n=1 Tax=Gaetbulibacter sp. PBL-D1 TaxID=3422594 RepID=UPI003D2EB1D5